MAVITFFITWFKLKAMFFLNKHIIIIIIIIVNCFFLLKLFLFCKAAILIISFYSFLNFFAFKDLLFDLKIDFGLQREWVRFNFHLTGWPGDVHTSARRGHALRRSRGRRSARVTRSVMIQRRRHGRVRKIVTRQQVAAGPTDFHLNESSRNQIFPTLSKPVCTLGFVFFTKILCKSYIKVKSQFSSIQ